MPGYVPSPEERAITWAVANSLMAKSAPVRAAAGITVEGFGPRPAGAGWTFNRGLRFVTPAPAPAADLLAATTGVVVFVPAAAGQPDELHLVQTGLDTPVLQAAGMPPWVAPPDLLVYAGVDRAEVRAAVQALLQNSQRRAAANKAFDSSPNAQPLGAAALAQAFVDQPGRFAAGIPCTAGQVIGKGATAGAGRQVEFRVVPPGVSTAISRNPAFYLNFWEQARLLDLSAHPLVVALRRLDFGLEATGVLRFVRRTGGDDANAPFTDPALPSRSLRAALAAAAAGDTLLILDSGTYQEAEHVVTVPVNITSAATLAAGQAHLGGTAADATVPVVPAGYPVLQGPQNYGGIRADGVNDENTVPTAGAHRVVRFTVPASAGIASLTKVVVRYGGAREGGGIHCLDSAGVVIASCHIHRNVAFYNIAPNTAGRFLPNTFPGPGWFEEGSGGGVGLVRSDAIIWGNLLERNLGLYGAAIGIFASSFPLIAQNHVRANAGPAWFVGINITDGGAIRVLQQALRFTTIAQLNAAVPPGNVVNPVIIPVAQMYDPAVVAVSQRRWIHLRGNRFNGNWAQDDGGAVYGTALARIFSVGNHLIENRAADGDGGGYRVSTGSVLRSINDVIRGNTAVAPVDNSATGGGIASRCSSLYLLGTDVDGNRVRFAGGGVSFTMTREGEVETAGAARTAGYELPTWDEQRRLGLGFTAGELMIEATTSIRNNTADNAPDFDEAGKAGGLYVFRFRDDDPDTAFTGDGTTVEIELPNTVLAASNDSSFLAAGVRPHRRLLLVDQTAPSPAGSPPLTLTDADIAADPPYLSHLSV